MREAEQEMKAGVPTLGISTGRQRPWDAKGRVRAEKICHPQRKRREEVQSYHWVAVKILRARCPGSRVAPAGGTSLTLSVPGGSQ